MTRVTSIARPGPTDNLPVMIESPSGTVTFLFTDVAGSTRLWEADRSAMSASLAQHDRILRDAIIAHQGFVFATGGDSFSAAFPTALLAIQAAAAAQMALGTEPWHGPPLTVRMAIHTGSAEERDGNYFGPAVGRTARIMSLGHGSQVLVSTATAELLSGLLEPPATLEDLGVHALKDMERPEHVFALRHPELPWVSTPLVGQTTAKVHLPAQVTSFVGRSDEMGAISGLLDVARLVTLTGAGGTGKTRLAVEVARSKGAEFPDGVWMTELTALSASDLVLQQVADTWDLRPGEGASLGQVVAIYLSTRELLLVVDNCEHVVEEVSRVLSEIMRASPGLRVLATSREALGLPGEAVYQVPAMSVPADEEAAMHSDAVALFLDRLSTVRPGYQPTAEELAAIVRVCRKLDGIPLGLELAAARLRSLSPGDLERRLDESFQILGSAKAGHRTLEATIDWSYRSLDSQEAHVFRRAAVFRGGFDLQAAEVVAAGASVGNWEILDLVEQLTDKSLLNAEHHQEGVRFRMLEPIRAYAWEQLEARGEAESVRNRHADHYASWVGGLSPELRGRGQRAAYGAITRDIDNVRAALTELRDAGRTDEFLEMIFDLVMYWSQASMQAEVLELVLPVLLSDPDVDPKLLTKGWWVASTLAFNLTDPRSADYGERAIGIAREAGDAIGEGWASIMTAMSIYGTTQRTDAGAFLEAGRALVKDNLENAWWDPNWDQLYLAFASAFASEAPAAEKMALLAGSIELARSAGDLFLAGSGMMSTYFSRAGDDDPEALRYVEEAVRILGDLGFRHALGHSLIYWGSLTKGSEDQSAGDGAMTKGAEILAEIGDIPCSLKAVAEASAFQLDRGEFGGAIDHLLFATRQARADPARFANRVAGIACRAALAAGEPETAGVILGYCGPLPLPPALSSCSEEVQAVMSPERFSAVSAEGSHLGDTGLLDYVSSWAAGKADG